MARGVVAVGVLVRDAVTRPDERTLHSILDRLRHRRQDRLVDLTNGWVGAVIGLLRGQDIGRLGEGRFAQVHDHELGAERLARGPRGALRLAAAALGAGREVEGVLPREVLDTAYAEGRVIGRVLEVDRLATGIHRQEGPEAVGQAREGDVDRRETDVEVLGVEHDEEEAEDHADVQDDAEELHYLERGYAEWLHEPGDPVREEGAGELAVDRELGAAVELQRPQDVEDHDQHDPRCAGVRPEEA